MCIGNWVTVGWRDVSVIFYYLISIFARRFLSRICIVASRVSGTPLDVLLLWWNGDFV